MDDPPRGVGVRRVGDLLYRRNDRARPLFSYLTLLILYRIPPRWDGLVTAVLRAASLECRYAILDRRLRFQVHSNLATFRYLRGRTHELRVSETFLRLMPDAGVFFDIGCSIGWHTILVAHKCARIIGFDPYDRCSLGNAALNGVRNFELRELCISDVCEEADGVRRRTLDSLIASGECPYPDALKMDVEGDEVRALRGGREMFAQRPPRLVLVETHSREAFYDCLAFLQRYGYEVRHLGCPKVNLGGDIYPLSYDLDGGALATASETRTLLALRT